MTVPLVSGDKKIELRQIQGGCYEMHLKLFTVVLKSNVNESSQFKQVMNWIDPFPFIIFLSNQTHLIDWGELDIYCYLTCTM